ncbi:hypothetical protein [Lysobacter gummosus]|uniref:hypothetical protein n=1 Tax=Lysobacter gummosus TaxID=262324 RepID=UPI00363CCA2E
MRKRSLFMDDSGGNPKPLRPGSIRRDLIQINSPAGPTTPPPPARRVDSDQYRNAAPA